MIHISSMLTIFLELLKNLLGSPWIYFLVLSQLAS